MAPQGMPPGAAPPVGAPSGATSPTSARAALKVADSASANGLVDLDLGQEIHEKRRQLACRSCISRHPRVRISTRK
jgi:hypothetical protein